MKQRYVARYIKPGEYHDQWRGMYAKVGGGLTIDLQEAQVLGWTPASHKQWIAEFNGEVEWELVPVMIVM